MLARDVKLTGERLIQAIREGDEAAKSAYADWTEEHHPDCIYKPSSETHLSKYLLSGTLANALRVYATVLCPFYDGLRGVPRWVHMDRDGVWSLLGASDENLLSRSELLLSICEGEVVNAENIERRAVKVRSGSSANVTEQERLQPAAAAVLCEALGYPLLARKCRGCARRLGAALKKLDRMREAARRRIEAAGGIQALRDRAVTLAEEYHRTMAPLYQSKRANVIYGRGGREVVDFDAYGKKGYINPHTGKKQPAVYRNAGARLDDEANPTLVIVENFRGTEVCRLPL